MVVALTEAIGQAEWCSPPAARRPRPAVARAGRWYRTGPAACPISTGVRDASCPLSTRGPSAATVAERLWLSVFRLRAQVPPLGALQAPRRARSGAGRASRDPAGRGGRGGGRRGGCGLPGRGGGGRGRRLGRRAPLRPAPRRGRNPPPSPSYYVDTPRPSPRTNRDTPRPSPRTNRTRPHQRRGPHRGPHREQGAWRADPCTARDQLPR